MKKLTIKKSEALAKKLFGKIKTKEDREIFRLHVKRVRETALILARKKKVDKKTIIIAANLHDIGRTIASDNHAFHSFQILKNSQYEISPKLEDCILNHGSAKRPKTKEGKIIQLADKLCWMDPKILVWFLEFSGKRLNKGEIEFLEDKFKKIIEILKSSDIK